VQKNRVKGTYALGPRCDEGHRTAPLAAASLRVDAATPPAGSSRGLGQVAETNQVVRRQAKDEHPAHPRPATVPCLAQQPDGLQPPEDLLHALAFPLARPVAGVARGASIDRTRPVRGVLGHVRRHLDQPEGLDEVPRVIPFVGADRDPVRGRHVAEHLQGRSALPVAARPRHAPLDRQAVAILHEDMALVGELRLVARRLANSRASGSVVEPWVTLLRRSP
jgi:hypothetical protein